MKQIELATRLAALEINRAEAARLLGVHPSSVMRFISGQLEIPRYVERGLENVERLRKAGIPPAAAGQARPIGRPRTKKPAPSAKQTTAAVSKPAAAQQAHTPDIAIMAAELHQVKSRLATLEEQQKTRQTAYTDMVAALVRGLEAALAASSSILDKPWDELEERGLYDHDPYGSDPAPMEDRPKGKRAK